MRAYLRLDPELPDHKGGYPDGALAAFVMCLCLAEQQPRRGRFRNERLLRVLLEKRARWVPFLIEKGDLIREEGGALYVDGWKEWQEGDWKVAERVARIRARKGVTPTVTDTVTPTVSTPYSGGVSGKQEAEAVAARRNDAPPQPVGFRPRGRRPTQAELLADIERQHAAAFEVTRRVARGEKPWEEKE